MTHFGFNIILSIFRKLKNWQFHEFQFCCRSFEKNVEVTSEYRFCRDHPIFLSRYFSWEKLFSSNQRRLPCVTQLKQQNQSFLVETLGVMFYNDNGSCSYLTWNGILKPLSRINFSVKAFKRFQLKLKRWVRSKFQITCCTIYPTILTDYPLLKRSNFINSLSRVRLFYWS